MGNNEDIDMVFLGGTIAKNLPTNAEDTGEKVQSLVNPRSQEDPLEKEMATHSSILPWKIPWTEEPEGVQSMRLQRVGHDNTTLMAESKVEPKSLFMKVKEESEKAGLKLNIHKTKIMASSPITSWQIDGKQWKQCQTLFFGL